LGSRERLSVPALLMRAVSLPEDHFGIKHLASTGRELRLQELSTSCLQSDKL
jgi:hypothetical protein